MSQQGVASRSQSTIGFLTTSATGTGEVSQQQKRQRTDVIETPEVVISNDTREQPFATTSATTVIDNGANFTEPEDIEFIRLERLYDKRDRYASHVSFLKDCINIKRIPNGLTINLEPTIGNHDDDFRNHWYERLQEFSLSLMQDIVDFSEKTEKETKERIDAEKHRLEPQKLNEEVMEALNTNSENRKRSLNNTKRRKFHWLKYNRNNNRAQGERNEQTSTGNPNQNRQNNNFNNHRNVNNNNYTGYYSGNNSGNSGNSSGNNNLNRNNYNSYQDNDNQNNNYTRGSDNVGNSGSSNNSGVGNYGGSNSNRNNDGYQNNDSQDNNHHHGNYSNQDRSSKPWNSLSRRSSGNMINRKPSRTNFRRTSNTNLVNHNLSQNQSQQEEINALKNEIATMKAQQENGTKNLLCVPQQQRGTNTNHVQSNKQTYASKVQQHENKTSGNQLPNNQKNTATSADVLAFIETTMVTLQEFKKQFAGLSDTGTTHLGTS